MFFIVLIIVFLILVISNQNSTQYNKVKIINTLIRQCARWAIAAIQDENAMVRVVHANYAAGYLWALKDIATNNEIESAININFTEFQDKIVKVQEDSTKLLAKICPEYAPKDIYLAKIAGDV